MTVNSRSPADPHESCAHIMSAVRSTGLTWGTQETPYSLFLTIRKRFLKDAKTRLTTRNPTHTLGVDRGNLQCEQFDASNTEMQLKIQTLEDGIERLRNDLEGEVSSNEKLNIALNVSKSMVDNLNTKYAEAVEQVNKSAKTFADHDKSKEALKKANEEVSRLTKKTNESLKAITKLRETSIPEADYNKMLQQNYHLKEQLLEADERANIAEEEIFTFKEQNAKLSNQVTKLMIALNNSNSCQDALEKQISDKVALDNNLVLAANGTSPRQLTRKELKKLRQKTKKILTKKQDTENNDAHEDKNLNESIEKLSDEVNNSLSTNGSDDGRDTASNNSTDRLNTLLLKPVPRAEGNEEVINAVNLLTTLPTPTDPVLPDVTVNSSGIWAGKSDVVPPEGPSAAEPGDPSELDTLLAPTTQIHHNTSAEGIDGVLTEGSKNVNNVERDAFIEPLVRTVHYHLKEALQCCFYLKFYLYDWPPTKLEMEVKHERVRDMVWEDLNKWRTRDENCDITEEDNLICLPCLKIKQHMASGDELRDKHKCVMEWGVRKFLMDEKCDITLYDSWLCSACLKIKHQIASDNEFRDKHQCNISSNVRKLLNELTVDQTENISNNFLRVFTESVCTVTKMQDLRRDLRTFTPPWGVLGLGYSLRNCSINEDNYLTHHALGTLADHLVRRGLFDAATAGDEDHWTQGEADQQTKSVDTKAK